MSLPSGSEGNNQVPRWQLAADIEAGRLDPANREKLKATSPVLRRHLEAIERLESQPKHVQETETKIMAAFLEPEPRDTLHRLMEEALAAGNTVKCAQVWQSIKSLNELDELNPINDVPAARAARHTGAVTRLHRPKATRLFPAFVFALTVFIVGIIALKTARRESVRPMPNAEVAVVREGSRPSTVDGKIPPRRPEPHQSRPKPHLLQTSQASKSSPALPHHPRHTPSPPSRQSDSHYAYSSRQKNQNTSDPTPNPLPNPSALGETYSSGSVAWWQDWSAEANTSSHPALPKASPAPAATTSTPLDPEEATRLASIRSLADQVRSGNFSLLRAAFTGPMLGTSEPETGPRLHLQMPASREIVPSLHPELRWEAFRGKDKDCEYRVEIYQEPMANPENLRITVQTPLTVVTIGQRLEPGIPCYWRVVLVDAKGQPIHDDHGNQITSGTLQEFCTFGDPTLLGESDPEGSLRELESRLADKPFERGVLYAKLGLFSRAEAAFGAAADGPDGDRARECQSLLRYPVAK